MSLEGRGSVSIFPAPFPTASASFTYNTLLIVQSIICSTLDFGLIIRLQFTPALAKCCKLGTEVLKLTKRADTLVEGHLSNLIFSLSPLVLSLTEQF